MKVFIFCGFWLLSSFSLEAVNSFKLRPELLTTKTRSADEAIMAGFSKIGPSALDVDWWEEGQDELKNAMKPELRNREEAKNVILFIGDGMGPVTVSAARILHAQKRPNLIGKNRLLAFENFPHLGLSRTYNVDKQVTDSAASGTAMVSGVKTKQQLIGLNSKAELANCTTSKGNEISSILHYAHEALRLWNNLPEDVRSYEDLSEFKIKLNRDINSVNNYFIEAKEEKKWTGVVTTTRVTHATPAAAYAHAASRWWESDSDQDFWDNLNEAERKLCPDIAKQLIDNNDYIRVILGGGREKFLPKNESDPEYPNDKGHRIDHRNLIKDWQSKHKNGRYAWNASQFQNIDPQKTDYVLGLFEPSHMQYDLERTNEPSLQEMVEKAIKLLQRSSHGYFLLVEGGRIDHAHHQTEAKLALHDTIAMADAVAKAKAITNEEDTLIVVTADHAHVFDFGGYSSIENDVLGLANDEYIKYAADGKRYTSLGYYNGPGYLNHLDFSAQNTPRKNLTENETRGETHGGEDVGIYASGPMAHLFHGSHEQSYIAHAMMYASCVGPNKDHCDTSSAISTKAAILPALSSVIFTFFS